MCVCVCVCVCVCQTYHKERTPVDSRLQRQPRSSTSPHTRSQNFLHCTPPVFLWPAHPPPAHWGLGLSGLLTVGLHHPHIELWWRERVSEREREKERERERERERVFVCVCVCVCVYVCDGWPMAMRILGP